MSTITHREIAHRISALGLAVFTTLSMLGAVNLLAVEPSPDSLLARQAETLEIAAAPLPAHPRS